MQLVMFSRARLVLSFACGFVGRMGFIFFLERVVEIAEKAHFVRRPTPSIDHNQSQLFLFVFYSGSIAYNGPALYAASQRMCLLVDYDRSRGW